MSAVAADRAANGPPPSAARQARARRRLVGRGLLYLAAILLALWVLAPIYLITVTAFSPRDAIYDDP